MTCVEGPYILIKKTHFLATRLPSFNEGQVGAWSWDLGSGAVGLKIEKTTHIIMMMYFDSHA